MVLTVFETRCADESIARQPLSLCSSKGGLEVGAGGISALSMPFAGASCLLELSLSDLEADVGL